MKNTYHNKNLSLTVLALAIALSTSLSAAYTAGESRYAIQLSSSEETLPRLAVSAKGGMQTEIVLDSSVEVNGDYKFDKLTSLPKTNPAENEINKYVAERILKGEEGYVVATKKSLDSKIHYIFTPGENFSGQIHLAYSNTTGDKGSPNFVWGVCTITVQSLADRVLQLESAVKEEELARKSGISQLNLNQTKLATALSILNCRIGALTNQINELNANPCSWGEWFKSLWR